MPVACYLQFGLANFLKEECESGNNKVPFSKKQLRLFGKAGRRGPSRPAQTAVEHNRAQNTGRGYDSIEALIHRKRFAKASSVRKKLISRSNFRGLHSFLLFYMKLSFSPSIYRQNSCSPNFLDFNPSFYTSYHVGMPHHHIVR